LEPLGAQRCPRKALLMKSHTLRIFLFPARMKQAGCRSKRKPSEAASWRASAESKVEEGKTPRRSTSKLASTKRRPVAADKQTAIGLLVVR